MGEVQLHSQGFKITANVLMTTISEIIVNTQEHM